MAVPSGTIYDQLAFVLLKVLAQLNVLTACRLSTTAGLVQLAEVEKDKQLRLGLRFMGYCFDGLRIWIKLG